jgi:hypothetical protein
MVYNLINVPGKMTREQLIDILGLRDGDFSRLYKQSLYWTLTSTNNNFNQCFENVLKKIKFEDDKVLRYEVTTSKQLVKQVLKKLQQLSYMKETNQLGAEKVATNTPNVNIRKDSYNKDNSSSNSTEAFSWRRKSELSSNKNE